MTVGEESSKRNDTRVGETTAEFDYATLGLRFIANVIDSFVIIGSISVAVLLFIADLPRIVANIGLVLAAVFSLFYILVLEVVWSGQTLGKNLVGIKIVQDDGSEADIIHSVIRNFIGLIGQALTELSETVLSELCQNRSC
ncbi:MAG: RDD family protein [Halobacteriaceae archaeon]